MLVASAYRREECGNAKALKDYWVGSGEEWSRIVHSETLDLDQHQGNG